MAGPELTDAQRAVIRPNCQLAEYELRSNSTSLIVRLRSPSSTSVLATIVSSPSLALATSNTKEGAGQWKRERVESWQWSYPPPVSQLSPFNSLANSPPQQHSCRVDYGNSEYAGCQPASQPQRWALEFVSSALSSYLNHDAGRRSLPPAFGASGLKLNSPPWRMHRPRGTR